MDYKEALRYIQNIQERLGSDYSLREVTELSRRLGRPERNLKIIHIAGTNGKGSVGNYISNMLAQAGYTVGRYVSPTLFDYRERVQKVTMVSGRAESEWMAQEEMAGALTILKEVCEKMCQDGFMQPTAFEMETIMAFWLFNRWKVDVAVVETGLGGRLDATNIIEHPLLCVFTSISRDHMQFLGNTIEEIAAEKYGIIQEGTTVVSCFQEECHLLLEERCKEKKAALSYACLHSGKNGDIQEEEPSVASGVRKSSFQGSYQKENAALAEKAVLQLQKMGEFFVSGIQRKEALQYSRWRGRFDIVSEQPFVLADGAHNEDAAKKLCLSLKACFPGEKFRFILGVFRDKEYEKMIVHLLPFAEQIYTVPTAGKRGLSAKELWESVQETEKIRFGMIESYRGAVCCSSIKDALDACIAGSAAVKTVVCGSLSIIKEVYCYFSL